MSENFLGLFSSATDVVSLKPGQALFTKGEHGSQMFIIKSGELTVGDGNHVFQRLSAGDLIGEMALIDDQPRSATVHAVTDAEAIPIDERRFLFLVQHTPLFAIRVMRVLSSRLRAMNDRPPN